MDIYNREINRIVDSVSRMRKEGDVLDSVEQIVEDFTSRGFSGDDIPHVLTRVYNGLSPRKRARKRIRSHFGRAIHYFSHRDSSFGVGGNAATGVAGALPANPAIPAAVPPAISPTSPVAQAATAAVQPQAPIQAQATVPTATGTAAVATPDYNQLAGIAQNAAQAAALLGQ